MIEYSDNKITLKINPRAETGGDYFFRTGILAKIASMKNIPEWAELIYFFYYPICLSCVTGSFAINAQEKDIREMTVSEFMDDVPGQVMRVWADKVLELNKHFLDFAPADEKKS